MTAKKKMSVLQSRSEEIKREKEEDDEKTE